MNNTMRKYFKIVTLSQSTTSHLHKRQDKVNLVFLNTHKAISGNYATFTEYSVS